MLFLSVLVLLPSLAQAFSLREALDKAAIYFTKTAVKIDSSKKMVIQVVNYHSQEQDTDARKIETELYFALERQFPKYKLVLLSESVAGVSSRNAVFVKGTYEKEGEKTIVRLQAMKGSFGGIILAQTMVGFETKKAIRKTLVAVLDIEASDLKPNQRKAYSEMFRAALMQIGAFDIASSGDIDKLNPDAIQQATGCTRDECATIIGEQLGVDRSISTTILKLGKNSYLLSSKILDIQSGQILVSKVVEHNKNLRTIRTALKELAENLTGQSKSVNIMKLEPKKEFPIRKIPQKRIKKDSNWPWWYWAIGAVAVGVIGANLSGGNDSSNSGGGGPSDPCPSGAGTCGSAEYTW